MGVPVGAFTSGGGSGTASVPNETKNILIWTKIAASSTVLPVGLLVLVLEESIDH